MKLITLPERSIYKIECDFRANSNLRLNFSKKICIYTERNISLLKLKGIDHINHGKATSFYFLSDKSAKSSSINVPMERNSGLSFYSLT